MKDWSKFLVREWITSVRDDFPREIAVGFPHMGRTKIQRGDFATGQQYPDKEEWIKLVKMYSSTGKYNIFTCVYSEEQKKNNLMDCLFLDFDDNTGGKSYKLETVLRDVRTVAEHFRSNYSVEPDIRYSGGKGFHMYVYFPEKEFVNPKSVQSAIKREVLGLGVRTLDLVGESNRLCRLVYTLNVKMKGTPRLCLPIDLSWSASKIVDQSKWNTEYMEVQLYPSKKFGRHLRKVNKKIKDIEDEWGERATKKAFEGKLRPCFEDEIVASKFPPTENKQEQWTSVAWEYLRSGYDVHEVYDMMQKWSGEGFNPETTKYQLEYAKRRDMTPRSCLNLWKIKWCMGEVCPLFERNVLEKLGNEV